MRNGRSWLPSPCLPRSPRGDAHPGSKGPQSGTDGGRKRISSVRPGSRRGLHAHQPAAALDRTRRPHRVGCRGGGRHGAAGPHCDGLQRSLWILAASSGPIRGRDRRRDLVTTRLRSREEGGRHGGHVRLWIALWSRLRCGLEERGCRVARSADGRDMGLLGGHRASMASSARRRTVPPASFRARSVE